MDAQSPMLLTDRVTTPTFVIHSEQDLRCPLSQGLRYYAQLKQSGCDAELLVFPGENHELSDREPRGIAGSASRRLVGPAPARLTPGMTDGPGEGPLVELVETLRRISTSSISGCESVLDLVQRLRQGEWTSSSISGGSVLVLGEHDHRITGAEPDRGRICAG